MVEGPAKRTPAGESPEWERICWSLVDTVLESGYEQTTIEAVIERAGVGRPDFDRHFSSKEDCFVRAFWALVVEPFETRVFAAFEAEESWRDGLRASAYEAARFIRDHPRESRFGSIEMMQVGPVAQAYRERQLHHLVDLIDRGRQELDDPASMTRATAEASLGAVYAAAIREVSQDSGSSFEDLIPDLMYIAVRPYLGHEVAREELSIPAPPPRLEGGDD